MQRKRISHKKSKGYWRIAGIVCLLCAAVCGTIAFQHYAGKDAASVKSIVNQGYTEASGDSVKDIAANQELSLDERVEKRCWHICIIRGSTEEKYRNALKKCLKILNYAIDISIHRTWLFIVLLSKKEAVFGYNYLTHLLKKYKIILVVV